MKSLHIKTYIVAGVATLTILMLNALGVWDSIRWDLTSDRRYTLSTLTHNVLQQVQQSVVIDVLLSGDIPLEFKKLREETYQLLQEYERLNPNLKVRFTDPLLADEATQKQWQQLGVYPAQVSLSYAGKTSQQYVFPWMVISTSGKSEAVALMQNQLASTDKERIQNAVQRLEYTITDAFHRLFLKKDKKIAVLRSNGTLSDVYIADFLRQIGAYYRIAPFTLDSVQKSPEKVFDQLKIFDALIVPKPEQPFSDEQKFVIDQYVMQGGKILWLVSTNTASIDQLQGNAQTMAMPLDLNLGDMFFSYGFRLNYNLVDDLYSTPIVVAEGSGGQKRYTSIPWVYFPQLNSENSHLINSNLSAMRGRFMASIDTLGVRVKKTVLLKSSPVSKVDGLPRVLQLDMLSQIDESVYIKGEMPVSVLFEGEFPSMYSHRLSPVQMPILKKSVPTKMIVISDGSFIKNDVEKNRPLELGYDKWTGIFYDNKAFAQNSIQYLLGENAWLSLRNRKVQIGFLDTKKVNEGVLFWKRFTVVFSVIVVGIIFLISQCVYRKSFAYRIKK